MNIFKELKWTLEFKISNIIEYFYIKKCKRLYPDYVDDEYNLGSIKHIWGVKSYDDLSGHDVCLHTMNDIEIIYDRETKKYSLSIEAAFCFDDNRKENECKYLKELLDAFTGYMDDNNYSKDYDICLFMRGWDIKSKAESIEELYANFKIYVDGYCSFYGY